MIGLYSFELARVKPAYNPESMQRSERIQRLSDLMKGAELYALALIPGANLHYLTGLSFHLMERPVIGLFRPDQTPRLVLPELERAKAEAAPVELELFSYDETEGASLNALQSATAGLDLPQVAVEPLRMRYYELHLLQQSLPGTSIVAADGALSLLRLTKSPAEVQAMQRAAEIAEQALAETIPLIRIGMSERELASELSLQLLRAGSEPETPFSPIVASGPNAAFPHAVASDRALAAGETLLLDWGATHDGYISDITRTFSIGPLEAELARVHRIVVEANSAGRAAVRPGATCGQIDAATRAVIEAAGYGEYFIHRTGHGIGMEPHELPNVRSGEATALVPGMTFTVEPGIYLPGRGGVRIEDDMVVTEQDGLSLTHYPRELQIIE